MTARRLPALAFALAASATAQGLRLGPLFQDHMVVQRELPIRVWGHASPGADVEVALATHRVSTRADASGRFDAELPPLPAGGPHTLEVGGDGGSTTVRDVLVGEVWLCSGQSNMEWPLRRIPRYADAVAESADTSLRLFTVGRATALEVRASCEGSWLRAEPEAVIEFSAVAYWFGRALRARLDIPIGLVLSAWGGTPAEAWTRRATLEQQLVLQPILQAWQELAASDSPKLPPDHHHAPAALYNGMIAPLVPFTFRGVIWYQGESNAKRAAQYATLFPTMIRDWRDAFGQGDIPFLFVQLANWEPGGPEWPELREAQVGALRERATGMAIAIDVGDPKDIHPHDKKSVGERLALAARRIAYGERDLVWSGPLFSHMRVEGAQVRLFFDHAAGGLRADGDALRGFVVAGADRRFAPARARIDGGSVVVASDAIPRPVAVRYAWAADPDGNLRNRVGLPASPFRTDDWPGVTAGKLRPF